MPPVVAPTTSPTFWKRLKMLMPFPLFETGTRPENIAVIEGLEIARPKPHIVIMSSSGYRLPEKIIRIAAVEWMILPRIIMGFLPMSSEIVPIGMVAMRVMIPWTVKSIPTAASDMPITSFAYTERTGCINELEKAKMNRAIQRPMKMLM